MASKALTDHNAFIDSLRLTSELTQALKDEGEVYYVAIIKEEAAHVRKHLTASRTPENTLEADFMDAMLQRVIDEDALLTMETAITLKPEEIP